MFVEFDAVALDLPGAAVVRGKIVLIGHPRSAVASPAVPANMNNTITPVTILRFIISLQKLRLASQSGWYDLRIMSRLVKLAHF
jgi:hypothetical protein